MLLDEDDSRSSWGVRENESDLPVSQLHVGIQTPKVYVHLLELCEQTGWLSTHKGSSSSISICIYVFVLVFVFI